MACTTPFAPVCIWEAARLAGEEQRRSIALRALTSAVLENAGAKKRGIVDAPLVLS